MSWKVGNSHVAMLKSEGATYDFGNFQSLEKQANGWV